MKALFGAESVPYEVPSRVISRLKGHDGSIQAVCFTEDGKYCLTGGHDRTVRLWNPTRVDTAYTAETTTVTSTTINKSTTAIDHGSPPAALPIQSYSYSHDVTSVATSKQVLLASSSKTLVVTDLVTKRVLKRYTGQHEGRINRVAVWNDALYFSAGYDGTVRIWDAKNHSSYTPLQTLREAKDSVTSVLVSSSHNNSNNNNSNNNCCCCCVYTASVDGVVRVYDIRKGLVVCYNLDSPVIGLDVSKNPEQPLLLASCLDGTIRLLDTKSDLGSSDDDNDQESSLLLLRTYSDSHKAGQYALDCALHDKYVLTGSEDGNCVIYDLMRSSSNNSSSQQRQQQHVQLLQASSQRNKPTCAIALRPTTMNSTATRTKDMVVVTASYDGQGLVWAPNHFAMDT